MFKNKKILIGITGGIAAYKIPELVRLFKKNNAEVKVVMTENASNFVTPLTLKTVSNNSVYTKQFEAENLSPEHISLCDWADIFIIAPASANTIAKFSNGICDNLLTSLFCAFTKPVIIAPAMNTGMWNNKFVKENITRLKDAGCTILEPESGFLACGTSGVGRLCALEKICEKALILLTTQTGKLAGKKIVITAGGTRENIDPVRYIGNYSSGKMGLELARAAHKAGAQTVLISTCGGREDFEIIDVQNAEDMFCALKKEAKDADCVIMAAAVSDYKVKNRAEQKIKKDENKSLTLELVKNPDILAEICNIKPEKQVVVGFCAESENLIDNAKKKIIKKGCDFIVANDISRKDIGFSSDENEVLIIDKNLEVKKLDKAPKSVIAKKILDFIYGEN